MRSGLAGLVSWVWMAKAFTARDWAIFAQNYGQSIRIGKYEPESTPGDRDILWSPVANIAGDVPRSFSAACRSISRRLATLKAAQRNSANSLSSRSARDHPSQICEAQSLAGNVQVDESYFGSNYKGIKGRGATGKVPVFGLAQEVRPGPRPPQRHRRLLEPRQAPPPPLQRHLAPDFPSFPGRVRVAL